jgi:hypothetical protein
MQITELTAPEGGADITEGAEPVAPDYETVAKEKGWRPKEEFEGDTEGWVGAEEFIKRQPLFDKIKVQNKKLKELEKTVEALAKHYQTNVTQAKERAILDLKSERREAIELGEVNKVEEIDQKIEHVKQMDEVVTPPKGLAPELEDFLEQQKSWFNKDEDMTAFATTYNEFYLKKHPGELAKSLEATLKAVRKAYPDKFENSRKTAPPSVDGASQVVKSDVKYSTSRLNQEQKLVYNQLVKVHKQMSHDDYFKSLEDAGYLE